MYCVVSIDKWTLQFTTLSIEVWRSWKISLIYFTKNKFLRIKALLSLGWPHTTNFSLSTFTYKRLGWLWQIGRVIFLKCNSWSRTLNNCNASESRSLNLRPQRWTILDFHLVLSFDFRRLSWQAH